MEFFYAGRSSILVILLAGILVTGATRTELTEGEGVPDIYSCKIHPYFLR